MNIEELAALAQRVTYKPGWVVEVIPANRLGRGAARIVIQTVTLDAYTGDDTVITESMEVPDWLLRDSYSHPHTAGRKAAIRWIFDMLIQAEYHESREFFQFDGERIFAPLHGEQSYDPIPT